MNGMLERDDAGNVITTPALRAVLSAISIESLGGLYDAFRAAADVYGTVMCQPRGEEGQAEALLSFEHDRCQGLAEAVIAEAERRHPDTDLSIENRAFLVAQHEINCGGLKEAARTLAEAAALLAARGDAV